MNDEVKVADFLCCCETWRPEKLLSSPLSAMNKMFVSPATKAPGPGRASGGLVIFYNSKNYNCKLLYNSNSILAIYAESISTKVNFIIILIYYPPAKDYDPFLTDLDIILNS